MNTSNKEHWIPTIRISKELVVNRTLIKVMIKEYLNLSSISRILEPQSGSHIRAICRYVVVEEKLVNDKVTATTQEMSMEDLYDKYPWFFQSKYILTKS